MIAANSLPRLSKIDAGHVVVRVMRKPVQDGVVAALEPYLANGERTRPIYGARLGGFISARDIGHIETGRRYDDQAHFGIGNLMRNWNTVRGLGNLLG